MSESYIKVDVGGQARLVRLASVLEIIPMLALQEIGGAVNGFRGLANLRGRTVSVFDTQAGALPLRPSQFILVTHTSNGSVGLIVDEVYDVLMVPADQITLSPVGADRSRAVAVIDGVILPVLESADVVSPGI